MQSTYKPIDSQAPEALDSLKRPRRWPYTVTKGIISCVLILWLLHGTSLHDIVAVLRSSSISILLLAFSLHFLGCLISILRWRVLLLGQNIDIPLSFLAKSYMTAIFFNNVLPSTVGGDVIRIRDTYRIGKNKGGAAAAVFVDRLLGIFVLVSFMIFSLFISEKFRHVVDTKNLLKNWIFILFVVAISLYALQKIYKKFYLYFHNSNSKIIKKIYEIVRSSTILLAMYNKKRKLLYISIALSFILQINVVIYYFLISFGVGIIIPIHEFFVIVPVSIFFMMIPISINGLGLRENIFVIMMSFYNVSSHRAIAISWSDYCMVLLLGIIGGIVYIIRK